MMIMASAPSAVRQNATPTAVVHSSESSIKKKLEPQMSASGMNLITQLSRIID